MNTYFGYIVASKPYGTLYIGVTNSLLDRIHEHWLGLASKFTSRYGVTRLVYFAEYSGVTAAIAREKSLKRYLRAWKINLIERDNPHWCDLYPRLRALPGNASDGARGEMGPRDKPEDDTER